MGEMVDWDGQSPPTPIHQVGKPVITKEELGQEIPSFGKERLYFVFFNLDSIVPLEQGQM